jgi:hypothetical protein
MSCSPLSPFIKKIKCVSKIIIYKPCTLKWSEIYMHILWRTAFNGQGKVWCINYTSQLVLDTLLYTVRRDHIFLATNFWHWTGPWYHKWAGWGRGQGQAAGRVRLHARQKPGKSRARGGQGRVAGWARAVALAGCQRARAAYGQGLPAGHGLPARNGIPAGQGLQTGQEPPTGKGCRRARVAGWASAADGQGLVAGQGLLTGCQRARAAYGQGLPAGHGLSAGHRLPTGHGFPAGQELMTGMGCWRASAAGLAWLAGRAWLVGRARLPAWQGQCKGCRPGKAAAPAVQGCRAGGPRPETYWFKINDLRSWIKIIFLMIFDLIRSFLRAWSKCDFKSKYQRFDFKSNLFFGSNILFTMIYESSVFGNAPGQACCSLLWFLKFQLDSWRGK